MIHIRKFLGGTILLFMVSVLLTGCWAELGLLEEAGLGELAITAEDAAFLRAGTMEISGSRLIALDESAFNSQLGKLRLVRVAGENPRLFVEGRTRPIGEVFPNESKIRILNYNKEFSIHDNIFSVEGNTVKVRATASSISDNNVITSLRKGDMVVKLNEDAGWYQVKIIKNNKVYFGFINSGVLAPIVISNRNNYTVTANKFGSYTGTTKKQNNEYLQTSLTSFAVNDNSIHAVLKLENVNDKTPWLAVAFNSQGSGGIADYWKFFPTAKGRITDENGNVYAISDVSGLGFARNNNDWSRIKPGDSVYVTLSFNGSRTQFVGKNFSLSLEVYLSYWDSNKVQQLKPIVIYFQNIVMN